MEASSRVRPASAEDADACLAVYRPYVENTAVTFETEVPSWNEMATRIAVAREHHDWLVLERDNEILGYAYAHTFNPRAAYRWSAATSIYIAADHHRTGGGRELYAQLLHRLTHRGYRRAFAGITQPNEASNRFHRQFGFVPCGVFRRVGWKHDRWHDVAWMQGDLLDPADHGDPPAEIT